MRVPDKNKFSKGERKQKKNLHTILLTNPEQQIGIKTNRVYSQIARVSRCPQKNVERTLLIAALETAIKKENKAKKMIEVQPQYVSMKAMDIQTCFHDRLDRLPEDVFVKLT